MKKNNFSACIHTFNHLTLSLLFDLTPPPSSFFYITQKDWFEAVEIF